MGDAAELIVVNGRVFESGPPGAARADGGATAVAITGDRIVEVGSDAAALALRGPRTEVVDARGATVMPAFDDAHTHLRSGSLALDQVDLFGLRSLDEMQAAVRRFAAENPHREWIVGRGWLYGSIPGGLPTRGQLDAVVADRPAYLECFDGHTGWANTAALRAARIDDATPDPRDGRIVRDASGAATGILLEHAIGLVEDVLPKPGDGETVDLLRRGLRANAAAGIGACQDAWADPADLGLVRRLADLDGGLPVRVRMAMELRPGLGLERWTADLDRFDAAVRKHEIDGWLRGGILKSFMDGVVETRTASMLEPYVGTDTRGAPRWTEDDLRAAMPLAHRRGWQVELHAIGTAAVRQALDAFEALGVGEARARRHRVEHIETLDPADLSRFAGLGVVASFQPFHAVPDANGIDLWSSNLGPELAGSGWRLRSLLESGAALAFGSDWPVVPYDPFLEVHAAVNRTTTDGQPPGGFHVDEALSLPQALAAATWGSAFAEHAEGQRGALTVGRLADLVVLDRDLLAEGPSAILGTRAVLTVVGGRAAHRG